MADPGSKKAQGLVPVPSLDYSNEEELTEDTQLMYEQYQAKMEDEKPPKRKRVTMDVCVFMRDRSGIHVTLEEGHNAEAEDLFDITFQEIGLPTECEEVFALWLASPLMELRLKKKHRPFYIVQQWDEFCSKYTDAKAEDIHTDEPVLMFQRNVFYPKELEKNITYEQVLRCLYHEAKFNVIEGRYILQPEEHHILAGIQALIDMGKYNHMDHLIQTYRTCLHQFYPDHMYRKATPGFSFRRKNKEPKVTTEDHLLNAHRQISQEFEHKDIDRTLGELYRRYLEICWPYPFYGAAYFDSYINKHMGKLGFLKRAQNIETWTAINTNGVCVIDREKNEVILAAPFTELCWEYAEPQFDVDSESFPSLYLQFLVQETDAEGCERQVTKIVQVYSRQAKMMNALIETCVKRKLHRQQGGPGEDDVDSSYGTQDFHAKCTNKLSKMCLTTFSKSGEPLD